MSVLLWQKDIKQINSCVEINPFGHSYVNEMCIYTIYHGIMVTVTHEYRNNKNNHDNRYMRAIVCNRESVTATIYHYVAQRNAIFLFLSCRISPALFQ